MASYPGSHRLYAALLASQKRQREALEEINQAMRLDPLSLPNNAEVVRTMYYARDYDGALAQAQKAMQLDPAYYRIHFWLGRVYAQKGMRQQAVDEAEKVLKATPDSVRCLESVDRAPLTPTPLDCPPRCLVHRTKRPAGKEFMRKLEQGLVDHEVEFRCALSMSERSGAKLSRHCGQNVGRFDVGSSQLLRAL